MQCLDVATIQIEEEYREKGLFTAFMNWIYLKNTYEATYLEHCNLIIERWCIKRQWQRDLRADPPSFYLLKNTQNEEGTEAYKELLSLDNDAYNCYYNTR